MKLILSDHEYGIYDGNFLLFNRIKSFSTGRHKICMLV